MFIKFYYQKENKNSSSYYKNYSFEYLPVIKKYVYVLSKILNWNWIKIHTVKNECAIG